MGVATALVKIARPASRTSVTRMLLELSVQERYGQVLIRLKASCQGVCEDQTRL